MFGSVILNQWYVCVCVYVCVYGTTGWELVHTHRRFKITLLNTDQAHEKYLWTTKSDFSQALPDDGLHTIRNMLEWFLIVF